MTELLLEKIRHFLCFKMDHIHTTVLLLLPLELNYYYVFTWVKLWYLISFLFCFSFEPLQLCSTQMYPPPPMYVWGPNPQFFTPTWKKIFLSLTLLKICCCFLEEEILCTLLLSILNKAVIWYLKTPQE